MEKLRDTHPNLPVLGLSGYVAREDAGHFGSDGFLEKPMRLDVINALIEKNVQVN